MESQTRLVYVCFGFVVIIFFTQTNVTLASPSTNM